MNTPYDWTDLPPSVRTAIEQHCGRITAVLPASTGKNSDLAATLHTASGKVLFAKGVRMGPGVADAEAVVAPYLPEAAPRLLWLVNTDGWLVFGYEHITGHHADLSPGSPDLPLVAEAVTALSRTPAPPASVGERAFATRWASSRAWQAACSSDQLHPWSRDHIQELTEWESLAANELHGQTLIHSDLHPWNILVSDRARIIDWAWWRTGAPWIDTAFLAIRLVAAGHTPQQAQAWAERIPAYRQAADDAVTALAAAVLGVWELKHPLTKPTAAAREWTRFRLTCLRGRG